MPDNSISENSYRMHNNIRTKQQAKNYRLSWCSILEIYNPNVIELILNPVLMYLHVFSY